MQLYDHIEFIMVSVYTYGKAQIGQLVCLVGVHDVRAIAESVTNRLY